MRPVSLFLQVNCTRSNSPSASLYFLVEAQNPENGVLWNYSSVFCGQKKQRERLKKERFLNLKFDAFTTFWAKRIHRMAENRLSASRKLSIRFSATAHLKV